MVTPEREDDPDRPVETNRLLLDKENGGRLAAASIAPANPKVGVMLPYAPVQLY
ncbi:MAG: hypothetical protein ACLVAT_13710 [Lachnospiraceae bacterium]